MEPKEKSSGILYIVSTPIGNLEDITLRALRILKEVDLIAAEDTRRTRQLLSHYGIHKPLLSYHEHNRRMREESLLEELRKGMSVALVTDAGTPGISDPGEHLVRRAVQESIPLVPIPGPSALVAALSVSGLPSDSFLFYGFLPSKATGREKLLRALKERAETLIFYESPKRLRSFLEDASRILGERRVIVAREMTKVYEEVYRGTVSEVLRKLGKEDIKGEVTIVMEGCTSPAGAEGPSIAEALEHYFYEVGLPLKEAIACVAEELKVSKREVYRESLPWKIKARDRHRQEILLPAKDREKISGEQKT
ncbi:MAG: 16S rRNA (cytidine(1402)-2'-O)-methyltransferase [Deltaproteobacteria bacterium]|nr:16S rRNA (cytidine(1402)-2'-O)-methyltransferase [Deltaproteobacteria bacterium]